MDGTVREDERGFAAFQAPAPAGGEHDWSSDLSSEEIALASRVIAQLEILPSRPVERQLTARVLRDFSAKTAGIVPGDVIDLFAAPYVPPNGARPLALLFPTSYPKTYAEHRSGSAGFAHDGVITFRRGNGRSETYPLTSGNNVFSCLARSIDRPSAAQCTSERLRRYGIETREQRRTYDALKQDDPGAAILWLLIVHRDPNARFPSPGPRSTANCASSPAFSVRSGIFPGA
jgi:hypothetical protein